ncbi:hypothetical protein IQ07DRAFT_630370 [Pyrenochaeta sp. DS3sAY3a]|nr:hypothetical protein IQ07DRAFT_630370 [Pyrenochaeta sp. DS3sAY3a]
MNTIKSVYYGWGTLIVAGGGAYYFAKRSINADRAAKAELDRQKRIRTFELEQKHLYNNPSSQSSESSQPSQPITSAVNQAREKKNGGGEVGGEGNPSLQASLDPAPTRHAPEDEGQQAREKSKYEASDAYRTRKGDRFS